MNIGNVIKKYRKESGFTQEEMANRLGVTTPAVNKWENGVPIVKDTTPNMMNPRLYTTSYNKPQGQQFDDTAVLSFIKLQYT